MQTKSSGLASEIENEPKSRRRGARGEKNQKLGAVVNCPAESKGDVPFSTVGPKNSVGQVHKSVLPTDVSYGVTGSNTVPDRKFTPVIDGFDETN
jgi:hypothetical protein